LGFGNADLGFPVRKDVFPRTTRNEAKKCFLFHVFSRLSRTGFWFLVFGFWLWGFSFFCFRILVFWLLAFGFGLLVFGYWVFVFGFWFLGFGFWFEISNFKSQIFN
jgi:hypothetical protein